MIKSKDKEFVFGIRLQVVRDALEKGIKPTARWYRMGKNTVRKWVRRYKVRGTRGMVEENRAPHHIPHKTQDIKRTWYDKAKEKKEKEKK